MGSPHRYINGHLVLNVCRFRGQILPEWTLPYHYDRGDGTLMFETIRGWLPVRNGNWIVEFGHGVEIYETMGFDARPPAEAPAAATDGQWKTARVRCRLCGHEHVAVYELPNLHEDGQECTNCNNMTCEPIEQSPPEAEEEGEGCA